MAKKIDFPEALRVTARQLQQTCRLSKTTEFHPEDQLKTPITELLKQAAQARGFVCETLTEVHTEVGRPDIGVLTKKLLTGYCELKAPGKGANPDRFSGVDKDQWRRFKKIPNLLYTDGNEWALYRGGERKGVLVRLGDLAVDGDKAITDKNAAELLAVLSDFLVWEPEVPSNPRSLAKMLAPLCQLLRENVEAALADEKTDLSALASDWRQWFFPRADNATFADAYAQTLTYALLLSRFENNDKVSIESAAKRLRGGHTLLADVLKVMEAARVLLDTPISLLERVIENIDVAALLKKSAGDPWLYFYEDFLGAYDPDMRKDRGVYYTPLEVVGAQVRLVTELLASRFGAERGFADDKVITLDPACGTGTYLLTAVRHALEAVEKSHGPGMRRAAATTAAKNCYGFELLVGPYAVAHLRLTQLVMVERGSLPADGVRVMLTNTLDSPQALPEKNLPLPYRAIGHERERARKFKAEVPVLVCIGNPPYDRQNIKPEEKEQVKRKGGWVRFGNQLETATGAVERGILQDFIAPLQEIGEGVHAKNLYNDYVYFWRWALWKVFDCKQQPGIVSYITAASYLKGPGFKGMRKVMRETFDEMWIIDLGGDNRGTRKSENVFNIETAVAIAVGVRYGAPQSAKPAMVHYTEVRGTSEEKLATLAGVTAFADLAWTDCPSGWLDPFLPQSDSAYQQWPKVTDLFPWQENGVMTGRNWPIGETTELLQQRWRELILSEQREILFKNSPSGRKVNAAASALPPQEHKLAAISALPRDEDAQAIISFAYRSFDRQNIIADARLIDRPSPTLWNCNSGRQIFLTSMLTDMIGNGNTAIVTALLPDKHHFCNRGGKDVIPLWRDAAATKANIAPGVLEKLAAEYKSKVSVEDFFAYAAALLATPAYVAMFREELATPGPHLPITRNAKLFAEAVALGRQVVRVHTFGERWRDKKEKLVLAGKAKCVQGTPADSEKYPENFSYDAATKELRVGEGRFAPVAPEVFNYAVSGLQVVKSWLGYRMRDRAGKKSSPLDDIRPQSWSFDTELLELLWTLEAVVALEPAQSDLLQRICAGELFVAADFPPVPEAARSAEPRPGTAKAKVPSLFDALETPVVEPALATPVVRRRGRPAGAAKPATAGRPRAKRKARR